MALIYPGSEAEGYMIGNINNVSRVFSRSTVNEGPKRETEYSVFDSDIYNVTKEALEEFENIIENNNISSQVQDKNTEEVKKWIIRTYIDSFLTGSQPLTGLELFELAKDNMEKREAFSEFTEEKYD